MDGVASTPAQPLRAGSWVWVRTVLDGVEAVGMVARVDDGPGVDEPVAHLWYTSWAEDVILPTPATPLSHLESADRAAAFIGRPCLTPRCDCDSAACPYRHEAPLPGRIVGVGRRRGDPGRLVFAVLVSIDGHDCILPRTERTARMLPHTQPLGDVR